MKTFKLHYLLPTDSKEPTPRWLIEGTHNLTGMGEDYLVLERFMQSVTDNPVQDRTMLPGGKLARASHCLKTNVIPWRTTMPLRKNGRRLNDYRAAGGEPPPHIRKSPL